MGRDPRIKRFSYLFKNDNKNLMLRVYICVFYSMSKLFVYTCVRMPLSSVSTARVPSGQTLPGFPITAHHL